MELNILHERLGEFGLDPMEWVIEIQSQRGELAKVGVSSILHQDMWFEGWAVKGTWLQLEYCD
jgi:hypothetical protein